MNPILAVGLAIMVFGIFAEAARNTQKKAPVKRVAAKPTVVEVPKAPKAPKKASGEGDTGEATE